MGGLVNQFISRSPKADLRTNSDDIALWQSLRKGNDLAFSNLYQRFSNMLFNYGMHFCYNRELVKDCIQELFINIWNKRETLTELHSVKHYLFKSFRNLLIQHINRNRKLFTDLNENDEFLDFELSIEDELLAQDFRKENQKKILYGLTKISNRQREILILKFFNNLNYSDIASIMSITPASAHNLISKALQCMRVVLKSIVFASFLNSII